MGVERPPFTPTRMQEDRDKDTGKVFTVRLNEQEYADLQVVKRIIQQPKDSTAMKILAELGSNVIHDSLTGKVLVTVLKNINKNKRIGINIVE